MARCWISWPARQGSLADAPVIVIAAPDAIEIAVEAMKRGATAFLTKPITGELVADALDRALKAKRSAGRLERQSSPSTGDAVSRQLRAHPRARR